MQSLPHKSALSTLLAVGLLSSVTAQAANVTISFTNLSGSHGVALSPIFAAFHDGSFDPFNSGGSASAAIEALAEMGNGMGLASGFAATQPNSIGTTVTAASNSFGPGIYLPGATGSVTLDLDPVKNRYLSYFAMVVPSNDRFIGNDAPTEIALFDAQGHFTGGTFVDNGDEIWDAGTELDGTLGAAFLVGFNGADSPAQNGVIGLNADFSVYAGRRTAAGYDFSDLPGTNVPLLQISAAAVPLPGSLTLFGATLPLWVVFRRKRDDEVNA